MTDDIMRCPKCGEPHPDNIVQFAKTFGASVALCRKCTAIEKRERFGITDEQRLHRIGQLEPAMKSLTDDELRAKTDELKARLQGRNVSNGD